MPIEFDVPFATIHVVNLFMGTRQVPAQHPLEHLAKVADIVMTESDHQSVWIKAFTPEQRAEQQEADVEAWNGIIGILLAIVAFGSSSAALVVWAITKFS